MITFGELKAIVAAYDARLGDDALICVRGKGPNVHHVIAEETTVWCGERDGLRTTERLVIIGDG